MSATCPAHSIPLDLIVPISVAKPAGRSQRDICGFVATYSTQEGGLSENNPQFWMLAISSNIFSAEGVEEPFLQEHACQVRRTTMTEGTWLGGSGEKRIRFGRGYRPERLHCPIVRQRKTSKNSRLGKLCCVLAKGNVNDIPVQAV
jgi:hypothetical protein